MATQKVTFLNPQGIETIRDIESPEQITGFEKSGFKTVSNPFTTPAPNVAPPTTQTPNYGGLSNVSPAEQDLVKQGYTPEQIELRRQQANQGGRINIGQAGQAITSNLANYGIATSALPSIQSRADLMSAQEEAQIRANEEQRKQMLRQQIASDFQGVINRTEKQGEQQTGGAEAQLGISRGLGASSSRMQLVNQMQSDINRDIGELEKAKAQALAKLDFDSADRTEALINQKIEQRGKLQEEAFNQSMRLLQESRVQSEENKKQQERTLQNIVPNLYNELLDTENPTEVLQDYAKRYGLDPVAISSALISYGTEQRKDDVLASRESMESIKQFADLGGTGEFEVPGYGKINIVGKGETGNYIMEKVNGQYVAFDKDTGKIKPLGFSGSDVTSQGLSDLATYISSPTISINRTTGTSVVVPPAPGTPQYENGLTEIVETSRNTPEYNAAFDAFVKQQEESRGMSIANRETLRPAFEKQFKEEIRSVYDEELKNPSPENVEEVDLSQFSETAQDIIKGITTLEEVQKSYGTSSRDKAIYRSIKNEVDTAKRMGINVGGGFEEMANVEQALATIPVQLRNSDAEREKYERLVKQGLQEGKKPEQVADRLIGWKINTPSSFANNLRSKFGSSNLDSTKVSQIARNINEGNNTQALRVFESGVNSLMREQAPDAFISEASALYSYNTAKKIADTVRKTGSSPVGVVKGTMQEWLGKLKSSSATDLQGQIVATVADMRNRLSGTAVTDSEKAFLSPLIPELSDTPANFMAKLNNLARMPANKLNALRQQFGLPALDPKTLSSMDARVNLYK